jgi:hypothetical protein
LVLSFVNTHPVAGLQESSVQALPSLQTSAGPPTQAPPLHASGVVHAFPSLQDAVLFTWTQPVPGLQESSVQPLLSLQLGAGPPTQAPPAHVSPVVHALPSLQGAVLLVKTHPVVVLQLSFVHTLLSLQTRAGPATHAPPLQVSGVVHALPSLHGAVLLTCTQPVAGLQESSVQPLLSLQLSAGPPTHAPPLQASAVVHAFPSLHGAVLFTWRQPVAGSQESSVHGFPSSQLAAHES